MPGVIRQMGESDIPAGLDLCTQAGWNQTAADWRRLLQGEPEGCFVLKLDGCVVATVTTTRYATDLAWVGMMLVDAGYRRRGFGNRLLRHAINCLEERGMRRIMLDATPLGQALYAGLGFHEVYALDRWQGIAKAGGQAMVELHAVGMAELAGDVVALDRAGFGAERSLALRGLMETPGARAFRLGRDGDAHGLVLIRPGALRTHIGPLTARTPADAEILLRAALAAVDGQSVEVDVPRRAEAQAIVRRAGLDPVRPFSRMLRGAPAPMADWSLVYATAAPETG